MAPLIGSFLGIVLGSALLGGLLGFALLWFTAGRRKPAAEGMGRHGA